MTFIKAIILATALIIGGNTLAKSETEPKSAYLFVHFIGESLQGEQIYFAISKDGLNWTDLNHSNPILLSNLGDKGVRDPSIVRSPDGKKFTILATDLRIANGKGWDAARFHGSSSLVFWESTDLLNWSEPWAVDVSTAIKGYGCTWAPEAIYDEASNRYFVYWATISPLNGVNEARIYGAWTTDFHSFTPAELYIDRGGKGVSLGDIIDTQIIEVKGAKYRYYRASRDSQITIEGSDKLLGQWERIGDISYLGYTARQVEGPIIFPFNEGKKWGMLVDQYAAGKGYLPLVTSSFDDPKGFSVIPAGQYSLGASKKRHGGILDITNSEYDALLAKWPSSPVEKIASIGTPGNFLRHAKFKLRFDADVQPATDASWQLVPGLAGGDGTVSLRAVNFPDRYLAVTPSGVSMEVRTDAAEFAANATFVKVPGLDDASGVSFRLSNAADQYLLAQDAALIAGPAATPAGRRNATFKLVK